jgi:hypothetical protein
MKYGDLSGLPGNLLFRVWRGQLTAEQARQIASEFRHLPVMTLERLMDGQETDEDRAIIIALHQHT